MEVDNYTNGFPIAEAALSLRRAYLHALQSEDLELDPRPEEQESQLAGWNAVACRAAAIFEGDGGDGGEDSDMDDVQMKESDLAALLYQTYRRVAGGIYETYDEMPADERIAWAAVGRHSITLIGFDEDDEGKFPELDSHETHWREWAVNKRGSHATAAEA